MTGYGRQTLSAPPDDDPALGRPLSPSEARRLDEFVEAYETSGMTGHTAGLDGFTLIIQGAYIDVSERYVGSLTWARLAAELRLRGVRV